MHQDPSFKLSKTAFGQFFRFYIISGDPSDLGGVKISLSRFIVVLQSKLKMFCDQGVKYYTKTASGTQKITKVHFCLYLPQDLPGCIFQKLVLFGVISTSFVHISSFTKGSPPHYACIVLHPVTIIARMSPILARMSPTPPNMPPALLTISTLQKVSDVVTILPCSACLCWHYQQFRYDRF